MRPKPPKTLADTGRTLWRRLTADYSFSDAASLELLARACMAADRAQEARDALARDGAVITDRFGVPQRHPAVVIERDATAQLIAAFKLLGLHDSDPHKAGRRNGS